MDNLTYLITFTRVAQAGSFSRAARQLGMTTVVASKHVAKLERHLDVALLNRSTHGLTLTDAGAAYLTHSTRIVQELERSRDTIAHIGSEPQGLLRIGAPAMFAAAHVEPLLPKLFERYPRLKVEIDVTDRFVDIAHEFYDVLLRVARPPLDNLGCRHLALVRLMVCASPSYIEQHGAPQTPTELSNRNCLCYIRKPSTFVRFRDGKRKLSIPVAGSLYSNSMELLRNACIRGMGLALLPTYAISDQLRQGALVAVLHDFVVEEPTTIFALYSNYPELAPKVGAFVDFLVEEYGSTPYWDQELGLKRYV